MRNPLHRIRLESVVLVRIIPWLIAFAVTFVATALTSAVDHVAESAKEIPIAYDVDVVVVGGSTGAVAAACASAKKGADVFLLAPRPYLGTDMCSTLRLWLEPGEQPKSSLATACFGENRVTSPLKVKAAMDQALLDAGIPYLTGCYVTDVLRDEDGRIAGIVMANRSGRQAVRAKVVVDATQQATVARLAAVAFRPFAPGPKKFVRVVAGGAAREGENVSTEKKSFTYDSVATKGKYRLPVYEYTLTIGMDRNDVDAFHNAEQVARDMTYTKGSETASEVLFHLPDDSIVGERRATSWPGAEKASLGAFRPRATRRLYLLNAYADLDRKASKRLMRPLELMAMGARIGQAAADEAKTFPRSTTATLPEANVKDLPDLEVGENLSGIRSRALGPIGVGARRLPVFGKYDVVVVGGGTSGAPAGIGAAKSGAKTLVVEYLHELGGVGTTGLIGVYWYGLRRGFTGLVDEQVNPGSDKWNVVEKAEWLRRELRRCGADVWYGTLGCGSLVEEGQLRGVVVATPWGRGAVLATTVIDATGNADIAACAGSPTQYSISESGSLNVQIAGFPERPMRRSVLNTCYTMVDDTDVLDVWHLMAWRRTASPRAAFDVGQLIDSRDRRRIVGDYMLTVHDILNRRTFPDTISQHFSNFDAAAFPDAPLLLMSSAKGPRFRADVPYRCLLPASLDGILVVGLGCSAQRDAMTLIRMQPDLQNQGYAAGVAAAAAAKIGGHTRKIDIKEVQKQLVAEKVLDEHVPADRDSYPMSTEAIEKAAVALGKPLQNENSLHCLAIVMAHPKKAIPLLRTKYARASADDVRLRYAQLLAILGDATGVATLVDAVNASENWDAGIALTSQRKTGNTFSRLDRLVIALGYSRATEALPSLIAKLRKLKPDSELSHYKAISLALRHHPPCHDARGPLSELLKRPGFAGHATIGPTGKKGGQGKRHAATADRLVTTNANRPANTTNLNKAYKELIVAAMLYRCGDRDGAATTILKEYAQDVHGHFARYAQQAIAGRLHDARPGTGN